jgi:hypothetical protein
MVDTIIELVVYLRGITAERRHRPAEDVFGVIVAEERGDNALTVREVVQLFSS